MDTGKSKEDCFEKGNNDSEIIHEREVAVSFSSKLLTLVSGAGRGFAVGYSFKVAMAVAYDLLRREISPEATMVALKRGTHMSLQSLFNFLKQGQLTEGEGKETGEAKTVWRYRRPPDDNILNAIAGFVAGASMLILPEDERFGASLYCITRALADWLTYAMERNRSDMQSFLPENIDIAGLGFVLANGPILMAYFFDSWAMDQAYFRWIQWMGRMPKYTPSLWAGITDAMGRKLEGEPSPFVPVPMDHETIPEYLVKTWMRGFRRGIKVYFRVHIVASLLRIGKAARQPWGFAKEKILNLLTSAAFLTTYQFNGKSVAILVRSLFGRRMTHLDGLLAGFVAGLSIFIEHPRRRKELTLYCIPRAYQVLLNLFLKARGNEMIKRAIMRHRILLNILCFQFSLAIWLYLFNEKTFNGMNGLNHGVLTAVFGSRFGEEKEKGSLFRRKKQGKIETQVQPLSPEGKSTT
eukprot:jgi/Bigna1/89892/estExt_fgenesh1_pg.C_570079